MNKYTIDEIKKHNTKTDCWIIIKKMVYDITDFLSIHPGGSTIMLTVAGEDATEYFTELHKPQILKEYGEKYIIGELISSKL
jgi:L-lactate dehydrogenase (cytochrome)